MSDLNDDPQMITDRHWMKVALGLARQAEQAGEVPVGAVLVKDGQVLAEGYNRPIASHDPTAHAEIQVLRQAAQSVGNYRLVDTTLYVTLEPCAMCAMAMVHARVKRLVYAAREPRTGADGSLYQLLQHPGHNHQIEITEGVLAEQSREMLQAFFRARR